MRKDADFDEGKDICERLLGFFFFLVLLNMHISNILQASAEPPPLSALAGSHTERRTVGQAARCGTLLGLRQQLCKGLLLQPTLADAGGSRRSDVENHTAAPFHRPPGRLLAVGSRAALPDNRSGVFHAHIKICSICCHQARRASKFAFYFLTLLQYGWRFLCCCFFLQRNIFSAKRCPLMMPGP